MPSRITQWLYWDTSVFLNYFNQTPHHHQHITNVLNWVRKSQDTWKIVTSALTLAEVVYFQDEFAPGTLQENTEEVFDFLWNDTTVLRVIEVHRGIARDARHQRRLQYGLGQTLSLADSIHLASASSMRVHEMHSYDHDHLRLDGRMTFRIREPRIPGQTQGTLFEC